jgi:hypothetical protein
MCHISFCHGPGRSIASGDVSADEPLLHIVVFIVAVILGGIYLVAWWRDEDDEQDVDD